jgi:carbon-monoxide dehydrogenase medium subunit
VSVETLFAGPGQSTLKKGREILVGFYLEVRGLGEASAFRRVMRPQGVAIAILNLGAWLRREGDVLADVHIAVGPSGPVPRRMKAAEEALRGQVHSEEVIEAALAALLGEASFRTSRHRANEDYRRQMAGVLLRDALGAAWARAVNQEELAV